MKRDPNKPGMVVGQPPASLSGTVNTSGDVSCYGGSNGNIDITINDNVDGYFALNIDIDTIKNVLVEPKKYVNFCPKNLNINGQNILKQLVILNEEKTLENIIEKYNVNIK